MSAEDEWRKILELGGRAISPYNTQPWRFRWIDGGVEVFLLRTKNYFLKLGGISYMSLGHFLENLSEGARSRGVEAGIDILGPHLNLDHPIARVLFRPGPEPQPELLRGITLRITNRLGYQVRPLDQEDCKALHALRADCPDDGVQTQWLTGEEHHIASDILADLEMARLSNHKLFREAYDYTRFDKADYQKNRDRLDVESLALSRSRRWAFQFLAGHPAMHTLATRAFPWILRKEKRAKYAEYRQCSGLLLFTVNRDDYRTYIALGRWVQRILNRLAARGVQSHASLSGLYLLHMVFENIEIFSNRERNIILFALRDLENLLEVSSRDIAFAVRLGYCDGRPVETLRKPVETLFLDDRECRG